MECCPCCGEVKTLRAEVERLRAELAERAQTEARTLKHWKEDQEAKQAEIERLRAEENRTSWALEIVGDQLCWEKKTREQAEAQSQKHLDALNMRNMDLALAEARLREVVEALENLLDGDSALRPAEWATLRQQAVKSLGSRAAAAQPERPLEFKGHWGGCLAGSAGGPCTCPAAQPEEQKKPIRFAPICGEPAHPWEEP